MSISNAATDDCPFCKIAAFYPAETEQGIRSTFDREPEDGLAYIILSSPDILVFLDHAPMSRGHTLVVVRQHREKLSDVTVQEGQSLGAWLPILSRAIMRALEPSNSAIGANMDSATVNYGNWNVVQNNGTLLPTFRQGCLAMTIALQVQGQHR